MEYTKSIYESLFDCSIEGKNMSQQKHYKSVLACLLALVFMLTTPVEAFSQSTPSTALSNNNSYPEIGVPSANPVSADVLTTDETGSEKPMSTNSFFAYQKISKNISGKKISVSGDMPA